MSLHIQYIGYGNESLPLFTPEHASLLEVNDPEKTVTPETFILCLRSAIQNQNLDLSRPVIVVADKTRLCGYPKYLPLLIDELVAQGMDTAALKFIIAYGTHPPQTREECLAAYGEIYDTYTFIHHDASDKNIFTEVAVTQKKTPVRMRKDLLEASAIITMGAVCHHYFAGYGGGRKLIFPGCGEKESIYANHSLFLDADNQKLASGCQPGNLSGNPLADDLFEVEEHLPAHLSIHGLLDSHGTLCNLLVGSGRKLFDEACGAQGNSCEISSEQFDTVVASCGGFPKDINFIQAHKAIHNSAMFVKDGGLLLVYCECRDGVGSTTFLPWFDKGSFETSFTLLAENYEGNGGTALAMMTKLQRIRIGLVTSINPELLTKIGVERWDHNQVCEHIANVHQEESIACIPNASLLVKKSS
jgi:nickel-dependent lactate racemase